MIRRPVLALLAPIAFSPATAGASILLTLDPSPKVNVPAPPSGPATSQAVAAPAAFLRFLPTTPENLASVTVGVSETSLLRLTPPPRLIGPTIQPIGVDSTNIDGLIIRRPLGDSPAAVPEPSTLAASILAFLTLGLAIWRSRLSRS